MSQESVSMLILLAAQQQKMLTSALKNAKMTGIVSGLNLTLWTTSVFCLKTVLKLMIETVILVWLVKESVRLLGEMDLSI